MRVLILNTDYIEFLSWLYRQQPDLASAPYDEQMHARGESLFGVADFYSKHFRALGHEAIDVHANNEPMQSAWASEHDVALDRRAVPARLTSAAGWIRRMAGRTPLRRLKPLVKPALDVLDRPSGWFHDVLAAQIRHFRPDVIMNTAVGVIGGRFLADVRGPARLLAGQIASPLPGDDDLKAYDLLISSLPNFVDRFRQLGARSELNRFAFEPSILSRLRQPDGSIAVSFVGSLSVAHDRRLGLLRAVAARREVDIWGPAAEGLVEHLPLGRHHGATAWGVQMYQILADSRVTLNSHIGMAASYANNMRLFEATGVGTLLITDWKENLGDMFAPGDEVVAYRTPEECAELVSYYLDHECERDAIARRGQARTLREHTYHHRAQELAGIFQRYL